MPELIPSLYINITEKCNMKCEYCPTYGENWESTDGLLSLDVLLRILKVAHAVGIQSYRISGGEPMIFPERVFAVIKELNSMNLTDIILNSNGFNLFGHIETLKLLTVRKVKISLDALDQNMFKEITGTNKFDNVLKSIRTIKANYIPLELNMVVIKKNSDEFWKLLEFCVSNDISLKLLDLVYYEILVRNDLTPEEYFQKEYFNLNQFVSRLTKMFGGPQIKRLSSDRGIPMLEFKISQTATLTLKDGTRGSTFAKICETCKNFPCQEGLFHLSLSAEGNLTPCRLRRDLTVNIAELGYDEIKEVFMNMLKSYLNPFFVEKTVTFPI